MSPEVKSVHDILKELGKPTEAEDLFRAVMREQRISKRQARRRVKGAVESTDPAETIRRIPLPDLHVLYSLPEWTLSKDVQHGFYYLTLKELEEIAHENVYGKPTLAYDRLRHLIARQPKKIQGKMDQTLRNVMGKVYVSAEDMRKGEVEELKEATLEVISKISIFLHEQLEKETPP